MSRPSVQAESHAKQASAEFFFSMTAPKEENQLHYFGRGLMEMAKSVEHLADAMRFTYDRLDKIESRLR